jgi:hypothetical protein
MRVNVLKTPAAPPRTASFRGNKSTLPSKLCAVCGLTMTWRKSWAKNWVDVKVCSEACRRQRKAGG